MRSVMKQNDPLILTFDFGTQSVRASLFNKKGECVGMEKETYQPAYFSPKPGYAEMDPNDYYDYLCVACKRLVESHQEENASKALGWIVSVILRSFWIKNVR